MYLLDDPDMAKYVKLFKLYPNFVEGLNVDEKAIVTELYAIHDRYFSNIISMSIGVALPNDFYNSLMAVVDKLPEAKRHKEASLTLANMSFF